MKASYKIGALRALKIGTTTVLSCFSAAITYCTYQQINANNSSDPHYIIVEDNTMKISKYITSAVSLLSIAQISIAVISSINIFIDYNINYYQKQNLNSIIKVYYDAFKEHNGTQVRDKKMVSILKGYSKFKNEIQADLAYKKIKVIQLIITVTEQALWIPPHGIEKIESYTKELAEKLQVFTKMDLLIKSNFSSLTHIAKNIDDPSNSELFLPKEMINHIFSFLELSDIDTTGETSFVNDLSSF